MTLISKLVDIRLSKGEEVPEEYGNVNNSFFKKMDFLGLFDPM